MPSKWMPLKTMPLLFKSLLLRCLPLLLTVSQKVGSLPGMYFETIQSTKFEILQNHKVCGCSQPWCSAWVSQPPCDRGTLHYTRGSPGGSLWICAQSLKPKDWWLVGIRSLWELWALYVFKAVTSCILRQMLLLPDPMLRGLHAKSSLVFSFSLCFYQEGDSLAYDAFQRWYNITSGRLCPQSC